MDIIIKLTLACARALEKVIVLLENGQMKAGVDEQVSRETNARHLEKPEPGDYWNEMMMPALLVLARNKRGTLIIDKTVEQDGGWMWDFDKAHSITLEQLREKVRYCFCYPRFHEKAVGWWKEHIGIA